MLTLKRDQKREMDAVYRKFANHRDDLEKLSQTQTQLQVRARVVSAQFAGTHLPQLKHGVVFGRPI